MLAKIELDEEHQRLANAADYIEEHGWWDGKVVIEKLREAAYS